MGLESFIGFKNSWVVSLTNNSAINPQFKPAFPAQYIGVLKNGVVIPKT